MRDDLRLDQRLLRVHAGWRLVSTDRARPNSIGKRTACSVVISVPPASRNFSIASTPALAEAAADVRRLAVHPEELELVSFLIGLWTRGRRRKHRGAVDVLRGHDDHVVVALQIALLDPLLVDQVEGNPELVERVSIPAELLRAAPLRVDRDARNVGVVHRHGRRGRQCRRREAERFGRGARGLPICRRTRHDERARGELTPSAVNDFSAIFIGMFFSR